MYGCTSVLVYTHTHCMFASMNPLDRSTVTDHESPDQCLQRLPHRFAVRGKRMLSPFMSGKDRNAVTRTSASPGHAAQRTATKLVTFEAGLRPVMIVEWLRPVVGR